MIVFLISCALIYSPRQWYISCSLTDLTMNSLFQWKTETSVYWEWEKWLLPNGNCLKIIVLISFTRRKGMIKLISILLLAVAKKWKEMPKSESDWIPLYAFYAWHNTAFTFETCMTNDPDRDHEHVRQNDHNIIKSIPEIDSNHMETSLILLTFILFFLSSLVT